MITKSSTFLALVSILTILAVVGVAINDSEGGVVRKPFPSPVKKVNEIKSDTGNLTIVNNLHKEVENKVDISDQGTIKYGLDKDAAKSVQNEQLNGKITSEALRKAGFSNFVIKPVPFDGKVFENLDLSVLGQMDVLKKIVTQLNSGNEQISLEVYEFNTQESAASEELFEMIKLKAKDELGVTINQTNQFGLASFFINFNEGQTNVFLVVKTKNNVYSLSYPKVVKDVNGNTIDYLKPITELLKGLM